MVPCLLPSGLTSSVPTGLLSIPSICMAVFFKAADVLSVHCLCTWQAGNDKELSPFGSSPQPITEGAGRLALG